MPVSSREPRGSLPPTYKHWARQVLVPSALGRSSTHFQPLSSCSLLTRKVQPSTNAGHMKRHILFFLKHRCYHRHLHWPRSCRPGRRCSEPQDLSRGPRPFCRATRWLGCWPSAADHPCKAHPHPLLISGSAPPTPATPGPAAFREFSRTEPLPACLRSCFLQPSCGGTWLSGEVRALPFLMTTTFALATRADLEHSAFPF